MLIIHEHNNYSEILRSDLINAEVPIDKSLKGDVLNVYEVASFEVDSIIIMDSNSNKISKDLMKLKGLKANKDKVSVLEIENDEKPNFYKISEQINEIILNL